MPIPDDLKANYRALKEERGVTWAQLASEVETRTPELAAWFREQGKGDDHKSEPTGRRANRDA